MFLAGRKMFAAALVSTALAGLVAPPGSARQATSAPAANASEWPLIGGNFAQWQYSPLTSVNAGNVDRLGLAWVVDLPVVDGLVGSPLVRDGVVYQGAPGGRIVANDVRTGKLLWSFEPEPVDRQGYSFTALWATHFNRGVAVDDRHAYVASGDCRLLAVDRKTGKLAWEAPACDPKRYYGIVGAPRVGGGRVYIGNTNTEMGNERGYVDAYDAATGKRLWRFHTVPGDPAKGFENEAMAMASKTWGAEYWKKSVGAGNVWESITYDDKLDRIYLGVGNPSPANRAKRAADAGDELFSNSIVALDAKTGNYLWHYHTISQDGFDGDAVGNISIVDLPIDGRSRRVLIQASKIGFFLVLDPETGKLLSANNYVPNTWVSHVDMATGGFVLKPDARFWEHPEKRHIVQPGGMGARSWTLMAYSPKTKLAYIPAFHWPKEFPATTGGKTPIANYFYGSKPDDEIRAVGKLIAWDPVTQRERWHVDQPLPLNGGVLATAGDVVFQGTVTGAFDAYAATDGRKLWSYNVAGAILAAPVTVEVDGEQLVIIPVGDGGSTAAAQVYSRLAANPQHESPSRLLAFKLGGAAKMPEPTLATPLPQPFQPRQPEELAAKGREIYFANGCYACHGVDAEKRGRGIPDLRRTARERFDLMPEIVIQGAFAQTGMPAFPHLTQDDVKALQAFITNRAWAGYELQQKQRLSRR